MDKFLKNFMWLTGKRLVGNLLLSGLSLVIIFGFLGLAAAALWIGDSLGIERGLIIFGLVVLFGGGMLALFASGLLWAFQRRGKYTAQLEQHFSWLGPRQAMGMIRQGFTGNWLGRRTTIRITARPRGRGLVFEIFVDAQVPSFLIAGTRTSLGTMLQSAFGSNEMRDSGLDPDRYIVNAEDHSVARQILADQRMRSALMHLIEARSGLEIRAVRIQGQQGVLTISHPGAAVFDAQRSQQLVRSLILLAAAVEANGDLSSIDPALLANDSLDTAGGQRPPDASPPVDEASVVPLDMIDTVPNNDSILDAEVVDFDFRPTLDTESFDPAFYDEQSPDEGVGPAEENSLSRPAEAGADSIHRSNDNEEDRSQRARRSTDEMID